ncbi:glutathione S-transferase family protein [Vibrio hangzhouensis]|uniref:Putative glutathione S-transferase n=1 Tax=Vibrio hangzhouensis TaxID=462991 RepID=A0A1H5TE96_9VIBR|nr:glutathione S-transferase C-terminal domain-containing protein [Vibrio hangzhouensis]SEF61162.1 putative glutathione S-transferase [Vibrio hangzhouensis]
MGKLVAGQWFNDDELRALEQQQYQRTNGKFQRDSAQFRHWVTLDGSAGVSGIGGFKAEAGRYHLFAALNCPWAHRTLIYRSVKHLEKVVSLSLVKPLRTGEGWVFEANTAKGESRFTDSLLGLTALHQLYSKADSNYTGRVTVPVLWDKQQSKIVSTESADIIRMFNSAFNDITGDTQNFYPDALKKDVDELNEFIYRNLNNGVYQAGFARTQAAYNEAVANVFSALDSLELRLSESRYLLGQHVTEADWRLLPTLVRFDVAYFTAFKCNLRALRDYPQLSRYLRDMVSLPNVAKTIELDVYRKGYHSVSPLRNPHGIVSIGLEPAFSLSSEVKHV